MFRSPKTLFFVAIWLCVAGFAVSFLTTAPPATAAPSDVPQDAEPFYCWYYNVPADSTWYAIDEYTNPSCWSDGAFVDLFPVAAGSYVFVTDFSVTPTSASAEGPHRYLFRRGFESGGVFSPFNSGPDLMSGVPETVGIHGNAPLLIVEPTRYLIIYNESPDDAGSEWSDFHVAGYVVPDTTVNPTALGNIRRAITPPAGTPWLLLLLFVALSFFTYQQIRREEAST